MGSDCTQRARVFDGAEESLKRELVVARYKYNRCH